MSHFRDWLSRVAAWIAPPTSLWFAMGGLLLPLLIVLYFGVSESSIRIAGLVLQLLGISTVIWGIHETRTLFEQTTLLSMVKDWFKRFPHYKSDTVLGVGAVDLLALSSKARAHETFPFPPNPTLEQLIDSFENNLNLVHERITAVQKELDESDRAKTEALHQERRERTEIDSLINKRLEGASTGGFHISAIGAAWLFVGVILGTASQELANWLK